jgi:UDP-glucose 4-epimerase
MEHPELYYRENVSNGVKLLEALRERRVPRIVFSSTAAVYGEPKRVPIAEADRTEPINPYGETKLAFEGAMRWYAACHAFKAISLRYFNVAGATERNGEDHDPETHIIPLILKVAAGELPDVRIFGQDYNTPDGTCIRDFIHVRDLASAHLQALEATGEAEPSFEVYNLGSAAGFSVREVIEAARKVTGRAIPARVVRRRVGDPPRLVASSRRARRDLGWSPRESSLEQMLADAWAWKLSHTTGYAKRKPRTPRYPGRSGGDGDPGGRGDADADGSGPADQESARPERVAVPVSG